MMNSEQSWEQIVDRVLSWLGGCLIHRHTFNVHVALLGLLSLNSQ